ncbi:MAG: AAA family ATPase [Roseivirga sp.]
MKYLPIGIQSIREILEGGYVYIDKTRFAQELIENKQRKHCFFSRPRRFGKSLFLSTLEEIFKGNKELFKGYSIYESNYDWQPHPVLHLDLYRIPSRDPIIFQESLKRRLQALAKAHQLSIETPTPEEGLEALVTSLSTNHPVVILVDEYDSPIIKNLKNLEVAEQNRELLQDFFGTLKSLEDHVRFTFVTGIAKFSKVSLFSGANHLKDITMLPQYAGIMGYTEEELVQYFDEHIQAITEECNQQGQPITEDDVLAEIKTWYNGYRFSKAATQVYNPFSTLNFLDEKEAQSYWYDSGTPSFLMHEIEKRPQAALSLSPMAATGSRLSAISKVERIPLPALMFQTGYLTIQDYVYDQEGGETTYTLDFPNKEVRKAFFNSLMEELAEVDSLEVRSTAKQLRADLAAYKLAAFVSALNVHFAKIPYHASSKAKEGFYQAIFLTYLELSGLRAQAEVVTNKGRIDVMCELEEAIYIFELKVNQPAAMAMDQAQVREYSKRYEHIGKDILLMGISFSSETRDIAEWQGELQSAEGKVLRTFGPQEHQSKGSDSVL